MNLRQEQITAKSNQWLKLARQLQQKKYREKTGLFLIEGVRNAEEALSSRLEIVFGLYALDEAREDKRKEELLQGLAARGVRLYRVAETLLQSVSDTENPQGVLLAARLPHQAKPAAGAFHKVLVIDGVQDPGNLGTMLRTAWACGTDCAVLTPHTADPYSPKAVRAAMGAVCHLPVLTDYGEEEIFAWLKESGCRIWVAAAKGELDFRELPLGAKNAWVLGNEANGSAAFWLRQADALVSIPLAPPVESLNVAVAAGILLFADFSLPKNANKKC